MAMTEADRTATPGDYFEGFWSTGDDPWDHAGRWYEARKYRLTVDALPKPRYERAFEPGCGAGVLTYLLAERVDEHLAMERHPRGVEATQRRCHDRPSVSARQGQIPTHWPDGSFDLIVLSELLYYLDRASLEATWALVEGSLRPGGHLVAVHHRPRVAEHVWTGDEIHAWLLGQGWAKGTRILDEGFVLDVLEAPGGGDA